MPLKPPKNGKHIDVRVHTDGPFPTAFLFVLQSDAAKEWVDEHVSSEPWQWSGDSSLAVDHRFARDLAQGMLNAGLVVL